jgi:hypothetical protein
MIHTVTLMRQLHFNYVLRAETDMLLVTQSLLCCYVVGLQCVDHAGVRDYDYRQLSL